MSNKCAPIVRVTFDFFGNSSCLICQLNQSIWWGGLTESLCMTHVPITFWKMKAIFTTTQKVGYVPINFKNKSRRKPCGWATWREKMEQSINQYRDENLVEPPHDSWKCINHSINIEITTLWKRQEPRMLNSRGRS